MYKNLHMMTIRQVLRVLVILIAFPAVLFAEPKYQRTSAVYPSPDVILINQDGKRVNLKNILESGKPVIVDFIYATCTTICPVLSVGFSNLQNKISDPKQLPVMISITIDPENDTPKKMKEYLRRYNAKPGWDFLTGSRADIEKVMRAFNAYIPDKMSHYPLNLIRSPKDGKWIRLFGILSSREFVSEYVAAVSR